MTKKHDSNGVPMHIALDDTIPINFQDRKQLVSDYKLEEMAQKFEQMSLDLKYDNTIDHSEVLSVINEDWDITIANIGDIGNHVGNVYVDYIDEESLTIFNNTNWDILYNELSEEDMCKISAPCPECDGKGSHLLLMGYSDCPNCNGTGEIIE